MAEDQDEQQDDDGQRVEPKRAKPWVDEAAQVATNVVTTMANQLGGTTAGAYATAASPIVQRVFTSIGGRWRDLSDRTGQRVLEEAEAAGVPAGELEDRIAGSDERLLLAGAAVNAGMRTVNPDKLRALGRALAAGVTDDALVDQELLVVAALEEMEAPHVKVLRHIAEEWPNGMAMGSRPSWTEAGLRQVLPEVATVLDPVMATLERHTLVRVTDRTPEAMQNLEQERRRNEETQSRIGAQQPWYRGRAPQFKPLPDKVHATALGRHVLELLREAGSAGPDDTSAPGPD